jgi:hypothetical protein
VRVVDSVKLGPVVVQIVDDEVPKSGLKARLLVDSSSGLTDARVSTAVDITPVQWDVFLKQVGMKGMV